jgi:hypothetical protein
MRRFAMIAGLVLMYILACALPVRSSGQFANGPGINCLVAPFIFFPFGLLVPFWWANPLFFGGCLALGAGNNRLAGWLGLIASLLAVVYNGMAGFDGMREGSALWMIAMFWLTVAGFGLPDERDKVAKPGAMDEL